MRSQLRTVASVVLVVMFLFLLALLLVALVVAQILFFRQSLGDGLRWAIVLVPAALIMVRGLQTLASPITTEPDGTPLTEGRHPALWALVRRLAVVAETEPPDEIYLTADANASVVEDTRVLGLVSIRRRMYIGAPLVVALDTTGLSAVLTHELAHYARHHTRLAAMVYRGHVALVSTIAVLHGDLVQWVLRKLLSAWTKLYLLLSMGLSRRQESEADQAAARAVGSAAAAAAWREIRAIRESWQVFVDKHVMMGWTRGCLPEDAYGGYARFRASCAAWLDELRAHPPAEKPDRYDTHPPMAQRIAAFEAVAVEPVIEVDEGAATQLLDDPLTVLDTALLGGLPPKAGEKRRVDWDTLARTTGLAWVAQTAAPVFAGVARLGGQAPTMRFLLSALDEARVAELSGATPEPGMGPRTQRELARPAMRTGLFALMCGVLTEAGVGDWELVWGSGVRFAVGPEFAEAIDAAVADPPDTTPLRDLLVSAGIDLDRTMTWRSDGGTSPIDVQPQAPGGSPIPG